MGSIIWNSHTFTMTSKGDTCESAVERQLKEEEEEEEAEEEKKQKELESWINVFKKSDFVKFIQFKWMNPQFYFEFVDKLRPSLLSDKKKYKIIKHFYKMRIGMQEDDNNNNNHNNTDNKKKKYAIYRPLSHDQINIKLNLQIDSDFIKNYYSHTSIRNDKDDEDDDSDEDFEDSKFYYIPKDLCGHFDLVHSNSSSMLKTAPYKKQFLQICFKKDAFYDEHYCHDKAKILSLTREENDVRPCCDGEDILIFGHYARALRYACHGGKRWRKRGRGPLQLYYNKKLKLIRLQFTDIEYDKVRLHQTFYPWFDFKMTINDSLSNSDKKTIVTVEWTNTDYVMAQALTTQWKMEFGATKPYALDKIYKMYGITNTNKNENAFVNASYQFFNIIKDFYYGEGLPAWCELGHGMKKGITKPSAKERTSKCKPGRQLIEFQDRNTDQDNDNCHDT